MQGLLSKHIPFTLGCPHCFLQLWSITVVHSCFIPLVLGDFSWCLKISVHMICHGKRPGRGGFSTPLSCAVKQEPSSYQDLTSGPSVWDMWWTAAGFEQMSGDVFKGIAHSKMNLIYSPSSCCKPVWVFSATEHKRSYFEECWKQLMVANYFHSMGKNKKWLKKAMATVSCFQHSSKCVQQKKEMGELFFKL